MRKKDLVSRELQLNKLLQSSRQAGTDPDKTSPTSPVPRSESQSEPFNNDGNAIFTLGHPESSITLTLLLLKSFNVNKASCSGKKVARGELRSCCSEWVFILLYPDPSPILGD